MRPLVRGSRRDYYCGMPVRRCLLGLASLAALVAVMGCDDPFQPRADIPNGAFAAVLFPMTNGGLQNPSGFDIVTRRPVRLDGNLLFDFAVDLDAQGRIVFLPQSRVGITVAVPRQVAMQVLARPYDDVTEAPRDGYVLDSVLVARRGDVLVTRMQSPNCSFGFSPDTYAKFVVDSVIGTERRLYLRGVVGYNCGFRSFATGVPEF